MSWTTVSSPYLVSLELTQHGATWVTLYIFKVLLCRRESLTVVLPQSERPVWTSQTAAEATSSHSNTQAAWQDDSQVSKTEMSHGDNVHDNFGTTISLFAGSLLCPIKFQTLRGAKSAVSVSSCVGGDVQLDTCLNLAKQEFCNDCRVPMQFGTLTRDISTCVEPFSPVSCCWSGWNPCRGLCSLRSVTASKPSVY